MTSALEQLHPQDAAEPTLSTLLENALAKHQQGLFKEAETVYRKILESDPGNRHALRHLGTLHLQEKRFADAVTAFENLRDNNPSDIAVLWQLADVYKKMGQTADLNLTYKELAVQAPETPETYVSFAERFFEFHAIDYALSFVSKAKALAPNSDNIGRRLGIACRIARDSLLQQGRTEEAISILRQELELHPNDIQLHRILCQTLGDAGLVEEGINYLKALSTHASEILELAPDTIPSLARIDGDRKDGIWSTLPKHDDVDLLIFAIRLPSPRLAEAICNRLLSQFPDRPALNFLAGVILREQSRAALQKSAAVLQTVEKSTRADPNYCFEMGLLHRDIGNLDSALIWFTRATMQTTEPSPLFLYELGKTHRTLGNLDQAADRLKTAIALKPDLYKAYFDLHDVLITNGEIDEAVSLFDNALQTKALSALKGVHTHPALMSGTADFIQTQKVAIQREIPSILLNSLGNSGSTYIALRLTAGLKLPAHSILLGQYDTRDVPIPTAVTNLAKGGNICRQHFEATDKILSEFKRCKISKLMLQIRDPRQLALSNLHYIEMLYANGAYIPRRSRETFPEDYFARSDTEKLDHMIETFIPRDTRMIQSWIDAQATWRALEVHYCTYEDMVADQDAFLCEILDFYQIAHTQFDWSAKVDKSDAHFRKGKLDEWRNVFTEKQKQQAWSLIPEALSHRFGWIE